jgi:hypothetical protein
MADIDLKTETPDTTLPTDGFLFGADSQSAASPSVYPVQSLATTLLGSTTLSGATVTADAPVLNLSQTWNASGTTFTGLKLNVTDTASAAASKLFDLQVGGVSALSVIKNGRILLGGGAAIESFVNGLEIFTSATATTGSRSIRIIDNVFRFQAAMAFGWTGGVNDPSQALDTILRRRAAANLQLGAADAAAPVAQTLSVQSVAAGTSNTAGANLTIAGSQGTGTGAGGSIVFQVAPAGSTGTAQNALVDALTIASDSTATFGGTIFANRLRRSSGTLVIGSDEQKIIFSSSNANPENFGACAVRPETFVTSFAIRNAYSLGWVSGASPGTDTVDLRLNRDAADTLAQRRGTNAQTFRVYNTFTSATNFERAKIAWSSNVLQIGTEKGADGGTARALELQTDGVTRLTIAAASGDITTTGSVTTAAPTGGTAAAWKLGTVASVTPTSPDRTIEVDIGGTIYYLHAKTTND